MNSAAEIVKTLDWRTQVVGVDEANFMGPELIEIAGQLADSGKQVILGGLDTDFMGRPFAPIPELLAQAESITKTLAICMRCGNPAKHTQRLVESDDLIVVGAAGHVRGPLPPLLRTGNPEAGNTGVCPAETPDARQNVSRSHYSSLSAVIGSSLEARLAGA